MINAEFLASCTDEQINKGVAWLITAKKCEKWACNGDSEFYYHWGRAMINCPSDYCNQIIHAWPIMVDNEISVRPRGKESLCAPYASSYKTSNVIVRTESNSRILRAAMEVYILMSVNK